MLPTIRIGSTVKISRQFDSLDYGDIVVFNFDGKIDDGASEEEWEYRREKGIDKLYELHGVIVARIVGLPGDSIAVEKEICIINGKKNKHQLIRKGILDEDVEDYFRSLVSEYEEQLPNGKIIHIYRFEITSSEIKEYSDYPYSEDEYENMYKDMKAIKVPDNHYFIMGDFRDNKYDSRYIGTIPREQIFGKVVEIKPPKKKQK